MLGSAESAPSSDSDVRLDGIGGEDMESIAAQTASQLGIRFLDEFETRRWALFRFEEE